MRWCEMCCWNGFATHFVENGSIVMYVARDGLYKIGDGNIHDQLIPNQPQKKGSIKWHCVSRGGSIYKMWSTKWGGPTPPTLETRWISILFCARPHPFCRGNWRGDSFSNSGARLEVRLQRSLQSPQIRKTPVFESFWNIFLLAPVQLFKTIILLP